MLNRLHHVLLERAWSAMSCSEEANTKLVLVTDFSVFRLCVHCHSTLGFRVLAERTR